MITTRTQPQPFDTAAETAALTAGRTDIGAVVTFTGHVRAENGLEALTLEHYPAMTDRQMATIAAEAEARWPLLAGTVIHRHGRLLTGEAIVFVAVASAHRQAAFEAAEFLMDWLKTRAPFWKHDGSDWVAAKASDDDAAARWGGR
ncbi:molybdenum cofactor biosynthesis protein MoaE [Sandarakinorhabdus sp. DWP1-3-1]|uniref:molybdenum cofactor biosynthesis protein MoaE n=1 Tax=Sandarakinorhabdus sp. DWP1-3-1 TaxID=2804627 RepID=UPI003CEC2BBC